MVLGFTGIFGGNARSAAVPVAKRGPVSHPQTKAASTFSPLLKAALHTASIPSQKHASSAKSLPVGDTNTSLSLVPGSLPATIPGTTASRSNTAAPAATGSGATPVIDVLKAALTQAGIDISGMQFNQHQDVVSYPGGSYINDLVSFQVGDKTHEYMANLVSIAPQVTVTEIQQLMAGNRGSSD